MSKESKIEKTLKKVNLHRQYFLDNFSDENAERLISKIKKYLKKADKEIKPREIKKYEEEIKILEDYINNKMLPIEIKEHYKSKK